uniref:ER membrane protein complex subunit 2 n=2 Tax=Mesocestoides corti TaxID=53468 RepID=A0A5K3F8W2_MESCO
MNEAILELRQIRENNLRESARVVELWISYIEPKLHRLGQEKWTLLEQVLIAALDVGNLDIAQVCLGHLRRRFPDSSRVNRLYGMCLETTHRFDEARALYSQVLEKDTTNSVARKRLIAIHKAQGRINEAIEELNKYLKIFMSDSEAWGELGEMYLAQGDYKHAAFCVEELILANPHNHLLHQRLGEIKYSEGGQENLEIARAYFAHACRLNPKSVRALYGLLLVATNLSGKLSEKALTALADESNGQQRDQQYTLMADGSGGKGKAPFDSKRENQRLIGWATRQLAAIYLEAGLEVPISITPLTKGTSGKTNSSSALGGKSPHRGDYAALPSMLEGLSMTATQGESPVQRKKLH